MRFEGLQYVMSRYIAGQWDQYGLTFWIPSQIEPTVALIGTSLPALGQVFSQASRHLSELWSKRTSSKGSSYNETSGVDLDSERTGNKKRRLRSLEDSEVELCDVDASPKRDTPIV